MQFVEINILLLEVTDTQNFSATAIIQPANTPSNFSGFNETAPYKQEKSGR